MSLTELFKALSDGTRREILELLKEKDRTAGEIAEHFQMTKPSISNHLKILHQTDLVHREKKGQHVIYSLNTTVFQDVIKWVFTIQEEGGRK